MWHCNKLQHFNVNLLKVTHDKNDKIQVLEIKSEGVLNQIKNRFLAKLGGKEVVEHLRDCLFHGMKKTIRDSHCYK